MRSTAPDITTRQWGDSISEDPIRFKAGVDFYRYVENRPVLASDPFGLQTGILPNRECNSLELWECSVKCGGFDNIESCQVPRFRVPSRSKEGFILWKIVDGQVDCACKGQRNRFRDMEKQPQCYKVPAPDPREVERFKKFVILTVILVGGAAIAAEPELAPVFLRPVLQH